MVQKSGYFSRSAAANQRDLDLIQSMTDLAVDCALRGEPGVIGHDEEAGDELRAIEFERIKGGKPFDISQDWFGAMLDEIGQGPGRAPHHRIDRRSSSQRRPRTALDSSQASAAPSPTPVAAPVT